ncbi:MAG: hypothetical protein ABSH01_25705 [Terriglobia bacterium]|jgi:hypothetical protein
MSFPINWNTAPDDTPLVPFFPDVPTWTKIIKSLPSLIVSTSDDGFDFSSAVGPLIPWTDPSDADENDGISSAFDVTEYDNTVGGVYNTATECLYASQWGFAIPAGATIQAVMVSINGVIYDMANVGFFPPGPTPYFLLPFALHVDSDWQYLEDGVGDYVGLAFPVTGQQFSDGSWDGTPVVVGTDAINFTDPSSVYPPAAGGLLPFLGASGITLSAAQVNDSGFGIGFTLKAVGIG